MLCFTLFSRKIHLSKCLKIIATLDDFVINHVPRDKNTRANDLAQQTSDFRVSRGKFCFLDKPEVPVSNTGSSSIAQPMLASSGVHIAELVKPEVPVLTEFLGIHRKQR